MPKAALERLRLEVKNLGTPEEVRPFPKGHLDLVRLNGVLIGRATLQPGWRWSECVMPLVGGSSCDAPHVGYMLCGRLEIAMDDGVKRVLVEGDAFNVPAGHDAWVVGDEPVVVVDFQGLLDSVKKR